MYEKNKKIILYKFDVIRSGYVYSFGSIWIGIF